MGRIGYHLPSTGGLNPYFFKKQFLVQNCFFNIWKQIKKKFEIRNKYVMSLIVEIINYLLTYKKVFLIKNDFLVFLSKRISNLSSLVSLTVSFHILLRNFNIHFCYSLL